MAVCIAPSGLAAAHAALGAAGIASAEPDDELAGTHIVLEAVGMAGTDDEDIAAWGGRYATDVGTLSPDPPGYVVELAAALWMTAHSAGADSGNDRRKVAVASKSGVCKIPHSSRSL